MNATISLEGLWAIVDSLSLKNKKWLSDKLHTSISESKNTEEEKIINGLSQSIKEAKEGNTFPIETLWDQL